MKILYAIQGTGNGHVSRAREIIPHLKNHGQVDLLLSGTQSDVGLDEDIKYRFGGFGYVFGKNGGINFRETWKRSDSLNFLNDVKNLPVHEYDIVINDFEPVAAWSCQLKKKKSVALSHQCAFLSEKTPVKNGFHWGKIILKNYAPSTHPIGFHFQAYDNFIHTPVIRSEVRHLKIENGDFYTVYLPAYSDEFILNQVKNIPNSYWKIFSKHSVKAYSLYNAEVFPVENTLFLENLAKSKGLLTGGGFEGPAEALYLGKKVICVPMRNQYEQQCNALALENMGIPVIWETHEFGTKLSLWVKDEAKIHIQYPDETAEIIRNVVKNYL